MLRNFFICLLLFLFSEDLSAGWNLKSWVQKNKKEQIYGEELQGMEKQIDPRIIYLHNDSMHKLEVWQQNFEGIFKFIYLMKLDEKIRIHDWGNGVLLKMPRNRREFVVRARDLSFNKDSICFLRFVEWGSWFTNYDIYCNDNLLKEYNHFVGLSGCIVQ